MRSISTRLILAFFAIGIISIAIISFPARWNMRVEFIDFLSDQSQSDIVSQLAEYHLQNGSWAGIETIIITNQSPGMGMGRGPNHDRMNMHPFALASPDGVILLSTHQRYKLNEKASKSDINRGIALTENGEVIGVFIPISMPYQGNPRELEFIQRTNIFLLYAALIGIAIVWLLGMFLSRTITHPIRELTQAVQAISEGDLSQQVPIRSNDELGELAVAFNKMSAELARSINARKQMTADIAHELRTPLSLILGHAEAVHDGVLKPTRKNFEIIREEAERLENLINDLRTLSLVDAGELSIGLQIVEPERLVNEVLVPYQYQTRQKNIAIQLDVAPHLPTLEVDPGRMTQVFTNILDNALRHTPHGGRIVISVKQTGTWVEFAIQDNGPGVAPEHLEHLFERFYRIDSSRQREDGGSGLGLAIAKSIIQAHNGQLSAESEAGMGLRIVIRLPVSS